MKSVDKVKNIGMTLFIVSALVTLFISNEISKLSYGLALVMLLLEIISHSLNIKILQPKAYNAINNKAMKLVVYHIQTNSDIISQKGLIIWGNKSIM